MGVYSGQTFKTGNSTVAAAPAGTTFEKTSSGYLRITSVPKPKLTVNDFAVGAVVRDIARGHGDGEVVRLSSRFNVNSLGGYDANQHVLFVAYKDNVVRKAFPSELELL